MFSQQTGVFGGGVGAFGGAERAAGGMGSYLGRGPRFPAPTSHYQLGENHQSDPVYTGTKQSVCTKYKWTTELKRLCCAENNRSVLLHPRTNAATRLSIHPSPIVKTDARTLKRVPLWT